MLNRYEDGSIYIGKHCDNVENKVIVTVSLGADRTWIMERKKARGKAAKTDQGAMEEEAQSERKKWTLENGSLLVMQGATQYNWTHEIPKEAKIKEPRIVSCLLSFSFLERQSKRMDSWNHSTAFSLDHHAI